MVKPFQNTHPNIDETAFIAETAIIIGDVEIGEQASVWYGSILRGDVNYIRIGNRKIFQDASVIHVSSKTHPTILEDEITVGHRVTLHGCYIETGCLIGIGAIILDGVRVGENSLVAAGSLANTKHQNSTAFISDGNTAKVKRELDDEKIKNLEKSWRNYVLLSQIYQNHHQ